MTKGENHTHHAEHNSHHTEEHHNSESSGSKMGLIIAGIVGALIVIALVLILVNRISDNDVPKVDNTSIVTDIKDVIENKTEQVVAKIEKISCEDQAAKLTPSALVLKKNSIDTIWAFDNKNSSTKWTNGKTMVSSRFIKYEPIQGNVYRGDKPLSGEAHYYIYRDADIYFEINPLLKEDTSTLDIREGYGGQLFYTQEFKVDKLGLVTCVLSLGNN